MAQAVLYWMQRNKGLSGLCSVQSDKTKESIQEIEKELTSIIGDKPITADEFNRVQRNMTLQLPGMWETNGSVAGSSG